MSHPPRFFGWDPLLKMSATIFSGQLGFTESEEEPKRGQKFFRPRLPLAAVHPDCPGWFSPFASGVIHKNSYQNNVSGTSFPVQVFL